MSTKSNGSKSTSLKLQHTLEELQAQRDALIRSFPPERCKTPTQTVSKTAAQSLKPENNSFAADKPDEPSDADAKSSSDQTASVLERANRIVKQHIKLLQSYNEIRDIGQGLLGMIADQRDVRLIDVMKEFGVCEDD